MKFFSWEFTFKKVKKRKKTTGFSAKRWTKSEINRMLKLSSEGYSQRDIAEDLNRTIPAIFSKLNKVKKK